MTITQFDLEHIRTVANGCPDHPAYRVTSTIPDFSVCEGCARVFTATSLLCVAGILSFESMLQFRREQPSRTLVKVKN